MSHKLTIERAYKLGDYQSLRVSDEIEVPEERKDDTQFIDLLRILQLVSLDLVYQKYVLYREKLPNNPQARYAEMLQVRANVQDAITEYLKGK